MDKKGLQSKVVGIFNRENIARFVFFITAVFSVLSVVAIVGYLLYSAIPALRKTGIVNLLFGDIWSAQNGIYGIAPMICGTFALTLCAVIVGGTLAIFVAVWLTFYCPKRLKGFYTQVVNLLAGIPSIVYGLVGYKFLMPALVAIFKPTNAGFGLLASSIILSIMILPTITSIAKNSLEAVPMNYYEGALSLGCTKNQCVWKVLVPSAKSGIISAIILGIGRAVGETMAVQMIVGNGSGYPWGAFVPFTTLTSNIVQNWGYAEVWNGNFDSPTQQNWLFACGFVLLLIILLLNILLLLVKRHSSIGNAFFSRRLVESGDEHTQARHYRHTGSAQDILWVIAWIVAVFVFVLLLLIVGFVLIKGLPNLSFKFIFGKSGNAGITLLPALTATLMLIVLALAIALPIGVGTAIYLNEYAKAGSVIVKVIRLFIDTLSGIPSIIFGIFGYVLFVNALGLGYSLTAGSLTLAMIITPTIARSTEQSLNEVPTSMREASFSLGAGKLRTIFRVVLPRAISGIITALILSIGRIMSESAGLIFTVGTAGTFMPYGYNDGVASLAVLVWQFMSNGLQIDQAYATSAILIMVVVALNFAIFALNKAHKK